MNSKKGYKFDKYFLDINENKLSDETEKIQIVLSDRSLKLLTALVKSPNFVSMEALVDDPTIDLSTDNPMAKNAKDKVYASIRELRSKLKDDAIIHKKGGYSFNYRVEKNSILNWRNAFLLLLTLSLLVIGSLLFLRGKQESLTRIIAQTATAHLIMDENDGWRNTTGESDEERKSNPSKATYTLHYQMKKYLDVNKFPHRIGTSSQNPPRWESDKAHPVIDVDDISDDSKKCSDKIRIAKMIYTNIGDEPLEHLFDYTFKTTHFNGHNNLKEEWHGFFVDIPIDVLELKISFPKNMPYPVDIRLLKARDACYNQYHTQPKINKADCLNINRGDTEFLCKKEYFEEDKNDRTIIWHIENPTVKATYKIEWDWEK